jgi:hypothetical protein
MFKKFFAGLFCAAFLFMVAPSPKAEAYGSYGFTIGLGSGYYPYGGLGYGYSGLGLGGYNGYGLGRYGYGGYGSNYGYRSINYNNLGYYGGYQNSYYPNYYGAFGGWGGYNNNNYGYGYGYPRYSSYWY